MTLSWRGPSIAAVGLLVLAPLFPGCTCMPKRTTAFHDGAKHFLAGEHRAAESALRAYLADEPSGADAAEAHALLGSIALGQQQAREAETEFRKCLDASPNGHVEGTARLGIARSLFVRREYRKCRAECTDFLRDEPASPRADEALLLLGDACARDGLTTEAGYYYRQVADRFPSSPLAAEARARTGTAGPPPSPGGRHWVQVMALSSASAAGGHSRRLRQRGYPAQVTALQAGGRTLHAVRVGPYGTEAEAKRVLARLRSEGFEPILKP